MQREDLIKELARLRVERNWTYERLARRLGVTTSAIYRLLNEDRRPNDRTAYRIESFLARYRKAA